MDIDSIFDKMDKTPRHTVQFINDMYDAALVYFDSIEVNEDRRCWNVFFSQIRFDKELTPRHLAILGKNMPEIISDIIDTDDCNHSIYLFDTMFKKYGVGVAMYHAYDKVLEAYQKLATYEKNSFLSSIYEKNSEYSNKLLTDEYGYCNSYEYNRYQNIGIEEFLPRYYYDAFSKAVSKVNMFREILNTNTFNNCTDSVTNFKAFDYGHGNHHASEVYCCMRALMENSEFKNLEPEFDHIKEVFMLAALFHDESLAHGFIKKDHHINSVEILNFMGQGQCLNNEYIFEMTRRIGLTNCFSKEEEELFRDLVLTHRLSPDKVVESLKDKYPMIPENALASLSICDKLGLISPFNVRNRNNDENYTITDHEIKIKNRFLNDESIKINLPVFRKIFGTLQGTIVFYEAYKFCREEYILEHQRYEAHDVFIQDPKQSGEIRMK